MVNRVIDFYLVGHTVRLMTSGNIRCKVWGLKSLSEDPGEPVCPTLVCAVGILFLFDESIITVPSDDVTTMILDQLQTILMCFLMRFQ